MCDKIPLSLYHGVMILGIDPGYERCGFAVLDDNSELVNFGVIKTKPKDFSLRLQEIGQDFAQLLDKYQPTVLSIEDLFFVQNVTTGMKVSEVRGVLVYQAVEFGCQIVEPKPVEVKSSFTGDGKADKTAMAKIAQMQFGIDPGSTLDDAVDAIACACWAKNQKFL